MRCWYMWQNFESAFLCVAKLVSSTFCCLWRLGRASSMKNENPSNGWLPLVAAKTKILIWKLYFRRRCNKWFKNFQSVKIVGTYMFSRMCVANDILFVVPGASHRQKRQSVHFIKLIWDCIQAVIGAQQRGRRKEKE